MIVLFLGVRSSIFECDEASGLLAADVDNSWSLGLNQWGILYLTVGQTHVLRQVAHACVHYRHLRTRSVFMSLASFDCAELCLWEGAESAQELVGVGGQVRYTKY